jgi:DNA-binding transcriptional LysR family regulator
MGFNDESGHWSLPERAAAAPKRPCQRQTRHPDLLEATIDSRLVVGCDRAYATIGITIMTLRNNPDARMRDLRVLSVMLREHNLTRAAEVLDTTQPAISKALARLRGQFGDPLFVRNGNAMHPTSRALEIAGPVRDLLIASDSLYSSAPSFDPATSSREFKLLLTDVGMIVFLPPLMSRMARAGSKLSLHAVPLDSRHFEVNLESGEADLALGAFAKPPPGLRRQRLYFGGYLSIARKNHPKVPALRTRAGFRAAQHIIVIASNTGHAAHQMVQAALETEIAPDNVLLRLSSFNAAAIVASRTDGVATVPANVATCLAEQLDLATFRPPIPLPPIEIAQYWHERYHRDPAHRWLRSVTFDLFAKSRA